MTCATRTHWQPRQSGEMAKHRFAVCDLREKWRLFPPAHSCERYTQADAQVVQVRDKWLQRK